MPTIKIPDVKIDGKLIFISTLVAFVSTFSNEFSWAYCISALLISSSMSIASEMKSSKEKFFYFILSVVLLLSGLFIIYRVDEILSWAFVVIFVLFSLVDGWKRDFVYSIFLSLFLKSFLSFSLFLIMISANLYRYASEALSDKKSANELVAKFGIFKVKTAARVVSMLSLPFMLAKPLTFISSIPILLSLLTRAKISEKLLIISAGIILLVGGMIP